MNFIGGYEKMMDDIKSCFHEHSDDEFITFGILIVDPRQRDAREYIINNFPLFDIHADNYFHFFIPGFMRGRKPHHHPFRLREMDYYFDETLFFAFCEDFCRRFRFEYIYNPMLILMTMQKGDINTAECIVIELDDNDRNSVRRAGVLFDEIFRTARYTPDLRHIQKHLIKTEIKNHLFNLIINSVNSNCLAEIAEAGKEIARYRIR